MSCVHENIILKSQTQAVGLEEESSAAASSGGLGCLVAKLRILIISHQVSPVNAGLHPNVKYTRIFSQTTPLFSVVSWLLQECKLFDVQHGINAMLRWAEPMSACRLSRCVRGLWTRSSLRICASWCVAISVQEVDEGEQIRGRY